MVTSAPQPFSDLLCNPVCFSIQQLPGFRTADGDAYKLAAYRSPSECQQRVVFPSNNHAPGPFHSYWPTTYST